MYMTEKSQENEIQCNADIYILNSEAGWSKSPIRTSQHFLYNALNYYLVKKNIQAVKTKIIGNLRFFLKTSL